MDKKDYYEILGIGRNASEKDIKTAYRKKALKFHPDRNPDNKKAEEKFKEASEAYGVLSDGEKRRVYDQYGHEGLRGMGFEGFGGMNDIFSHFSDIFSEFFGFGGFSGDIFGGRGSGRGGRRRGDDLRYDLEITFYEAAFGVEKDIEIPRAAQCPECEGTGGEPGTRPTTCPTCNGRGQVVHGQAGFVIRTTCPTCQGEAELNEHPCKECGGSGKVKEEKSINLKIPAGVDNGTRMRVSGEGATGARGGPPGDLYVFLHVAPHDFFERQNQDIYCEIPISFVQATLGARLDIPTLDGTTELEIPRGSQPGDMITLRDKGIPTLRGGGRGAQHVLLKIVIPRNLTERQEELLRQYADEFGEAVKDKKKGFFKKLMGD